MMKQKKLLFFVLFSFVAVTFGAVYKWKDNKGGFHYSDKPPIEEKAKEVKLPTLPTLPSNAPTKIEKPWQSKGNRQRTIEMFIAEISNRLGTNLNVKSVQEAEELYRWGEGMCIYLKEGRTEQQLIEGNMDQFYGPKLGAAIVEAAHKVICPEVK